MWVDAEEKKKVVVVKRCAYKPKDKYLKGNFCIKIKKE